MRARGAARAAGNPALGNSDTLNNNFEFGDDSTGAICPLGSHIRKAYPRDELIFGDPEQSEKETQRHRLLRRGIPFGGSFVVPDGHLCAPCGARERGLPQPCFGRWRRPLLPPRGRRNPDGNGGFGVSIVRGDDVVFCGLANSRVDTCGSTATLRVPLHTRSGKVRANKRSFVVATASSHGRTDKDSLELMCRPSTCGNGVIEADHENCDDGNRLNDDGCDQGCHAE